MVKNDSRPAVTLDVSGRLWLLYYQQTPVQPNFNIETPKKLAFLLKFLL